MAKEKPKSVGAQLAESLRGKAMERPAHISELSKALLGQCGGAQGIAELWHAEFLTQKRGSTTRARMLDMAIKLVLADTQIAGKAQSTDGVDDVDLLNELAVLEREHPGLLNQAIARSTKGGAGNAKAT